MAVSYSIYDETAAKSRSVNVNFLGSVLADSGGAGTDTSLRYYFNVVTGARDVDGKRYETQVILNLDELVLNGTKQRRTDTAVAYTDIHDMLSDYLYDMINGHAADLFSSGVAYKGAMSFS